MKKLNLILPILATMFFSCTPKDKPIQATDVTINATADFDCFYSRRSLDVFSSLERVKFKSTSGSDWRSTKFNGSIKLAAQEAIVGLFPSDLTTSTDLEKVFIDLSKQSSDSNPVVAYSKAIVSDNSASMKFTPLTGSIGITFQNESSKNLIIEEFSIETSSRIFYSISTTNFSGETAKNSLSGDKVTYIANDLELFSHWGIGIPVNVFPGGVSEGDGVVTIKFRDKDGKSYEKFREVTVSRPAVGSETGVYFAITDEMIDGRVKDYKIVYPKSASATISDAAYALQKAIESASGITPAVISDDEAKSEFEILIGETSRAATKAVTCEENAYVVKYDGDNMVVKGSSDDQTIAALYALEREVLKNEKYVTQGKIAFTTDIAITMKYGEKLAMRHMIDGRFDFTLEDVFLKTFAGTSPMTVAQGACSDGTYFYAAFRSSNEQQASVIKYRLDDYTKVAELKLNLAGVGGVCHVNDMAYDYSLKRIQVSGWSSNTKPDGYSKIDLLVDAANMKQLSELRGLTHNPTAICYNPKTNKYQSRSGTKIYVSSAAFSATTLVNSNYNNYGYTNQGGGGDDMFAYYPVNNGTNSQLLVFSWGGEQLWNVQINNSIESESLFVVEDKYYWWCYKSSAGYLYLLVPHIKYTPDFKGGWSDIPSPAASKY